MWSLCFGKDNRGFALSDEVDLERLARDHEVSGGSIVNVLRYAGIRAVKSGKGQVGLRDLTDGLRREVRKEGRISAG